MLCYNVPTHKLLVCNMPNELIDILWWPCTCNRCTVLPKCAKYVQNNKDYFDQSLDEIKLLKYINEADPDDENGMLRLFDYFYYKVTQCTFEHEPVLRWHLL